MVSITWRSLIFDMSYMYISASSTMTRVLRLSFTERIEEGKRSSHIMDWRCSYDWDIYMPHMVRSCNEPWYLRSVVFSGLIEVDRRLRPELSEMYRRAFRRSRERHRLLNSVISHRLDTKRMVRLTHRINAAKRVAVCDAIALTSADRYTSVIRRHLRAERVYRALYVRKILVEVGKEHV